MLLLTYIFFEGLEPDGGNEGDGDSGDALYLDDDTFVVLDALDNALGTTEVTIDDANATARGAEEFSVGIEIDETVILNRGDTDEVVHLAVGNGQEIVVIVVRERVGEIAQRQAILVEHLQLGDTPLGGVDEDEIADGRLEMLVGYSFAVDPATKALHRKEIANVELVECMFDDFLTTIGDSHGIP